VEKLKLSESSRQVPFGLSLNSESIILLQALQRNKLLLKALFKVFEEFNFESNMQLISVRGCDSLINLCLNSMAQWCMTLLLFDNLMDTLKYSVPTANTLASQRIIKVKTEPRILLSTTTIRDMNQSF